MNYVNHNKEAETKNKKHTHKRRLSIILIDSIYRKDDNYYPKVFLEKYFVEDTETGTRGFHFSKYKKLFESGSFLFFELGKFPPEI